MAKITIVAKENGEEQWDLVIENSELIPATEKELKDIVKRAVKNIGKDIKKDVTTDIVPELNKELDRLFREANVYVKSLVPEKGDKGDPGKDAVVTDEVKRQIALSVESQLGPALESYADDKITERISEFQDEHIVVHEEIDSSLLQLEKRFDDIKIPEQLTGENIVDAINDLDITPENQIDAKHIKNLPVPKLPESFHIRENNFISEQQDVTLSSVTDKDSLQYDGTTNQWVNTKDLYANSVSFDMTSDTDASLGEMRWDTDEDSFVFGVDGSSLPLNTPYWFIKNQTGAQLDKGTPVYATGTLGASGRITVDKFIADSSIEEKFYLGVLLSDVANGADGIAITQGHLRHIDTTGQNGETWNDGDVLYISPTVAGTFTNVQPTAPDQNIAAAFVIHAAANGTLATRVDVGEHIGELHDVNISSVADGEALVYSSANSRWENQTISVSPGGSNTHVQYNSSGTFAGSSTFTWNNTNAILGISNSRIFAPGTSNLFVGDSTGNTTLSGTYNVGIGYRALDALTTGIYNVGIGADAGGGITTGSRNIAIGLNAGLANQTRGDNIFIGAYAGTSFVSGSESIFIGSSAGRLTSTGTYNTFIGSESGYANVGGSYNFGLGFQAIRQGNANYRIAIGWKAGYFNSTNSTIAIGHQALFNATGAENIGIGTNVGFTLTSGTGNLLFGENAGYALTSGSKNLFIGFTAGNTTTTGSNNILLGYNADLTANNYSHSIGFGVDASVTASNQLVIGSTTAPINTLSIGVQASGSPLISGNSSEIAILGSLVANGFRQAITTVTASSVTLDSTYHTVLCDTTSNAITVNLPAAASHTGRIYNIKCIVATNAVTIDGNGSETIDGSTTKVINTQYDSITIQSDGSNWHII